MVTLDPAGGVLWFDFELWSHCSSAKDMDVVVCGKCDDDFQILILDDVCEKLFCLLNFSYQICVLNVTNRLRDSIDQTSLNTCPC